MQMIPFICFNGFILACTVCDFQSAYCQRVGGKCVSKQKVESSECIDVSVLKWRMWMSLRLRIIYQKFISINENLINYSRYKHTKRSKSSDRLLNASYTFKPIQIQ